MVSRTPDAMAHEEQVPEQARRHESTGRPDPEVPEKPIRRQFSARYKLRVLQETDACTRPGEVGAILRREGLYSSHLSAWRKQRAKGELEGLSAKKRGRKKHVKEEQSREISKLKRENERLKRRLHEAETIIEFQKKLSEMLGILPKNQEE